MVGRPKHAPIPNDASLNEEFWLRYGTNPNPTPRQQLLYVTIDEVSLGGISDFSVSKIAERLNVTGAMVNHYFGGIDSLLAEGVFVAYDNYVQGQIEAVTQAPKKPEARLLSWMNAQVKWHGEHPGWAAVLNYPFSAKNVSELVEQKYRESMTALFELNMAVLIRLVMDVRDNTVTEVKYSAGNIPRAELMADQQVLMLSSSIGLSTLGLAVHSGGHHGPSAATKEITDRQMQEIAKVHFARMIEDIKTLPQSTPRQSK